MLSYTSYTSAYVFAKLSWIHLFFSAERWIFFTCASIPGWCIFFVFFPFVFFCCCFRKFTGVCGSIQSVYIFHLLAGTTKRRIAIWMIHRIVPFIGVFVYLICFALLCFVFKFVVFVYLTCIAFALFLSLLFFVYLIFFTSLYFKSDCCFCFPLQAPGPQARRTMAQGTYNRLLPDQASWASLW